MSMYIIFCDILLCYVVLRSVVPQISLISSLIDYGRCFIGCPCTRYAELVNSTTLPARYELQPRVCVCLCVCVCASIHIMCVCAYVLLYIG